MASTTKRSNTHSITPSAGHKGSGPRLTSHPVHGVHTPPQALTSDGVLDIQRLAGNRAATIVVQRAINLTDHEDVAGPEKGHAVSKHVDVDNDYLKGRGKAQATRFKDLSTANQMADLAVADSKIAPKIEKMKRGEIPNASGGVNTPENGIAYKSADDKFYGAKNVLVEIYPYKGDKEPCKTLGYYVMTIYPKDSTGAAPTAS